MIWKTCGITYVRYAAEMADLLRKCIKEPYRTQLQNRNRVHFKETIYKQGAVVSRETYDKLKAAFEACSGTAKKAD
ncbi:ATP synthase epsilon chain, putative [Eimeria tenella]|uniref:ATP synthase epsilon chain, putative n=1 Tax=Eimeria tenella TaxID=5802 RepID=U6KT21_EIMTE|nr:ATP synthase epsilon chain, putative [Eimeria tenella]CDJ39509.1 ATP synthase epsilon chain, putative [Eimeria tenella]|eukprot:XP_013230264.1 ATP synthase epsilon chain, putative [Eimeria tenella]